MTKKIIIVLLAVILTFGLVACNKDKTQEYTLTFVDKDGNGVATITVSGDTVSLPAGPEISGYRFVGWYLNSPNSNVKLYTDYFVGNPATQDMTAYARYEKIEYTLSFVSGSEIQSQIKVSDGRITLPEAPEVNGYQFIGWCLDSENSNAKLSEDYFVYNPATQDMTAYASYVEVETGARFIVTPSSLNGCAIERIEGEMVDVVIPETFTIKIGDTIKEYYVEAILDGAFSNRTEIKTVTVPATVTKIGSNAFYGCTSLEKITVPSTVAVVGENIFGNTPALAVIEAPTWVVACADNANLVNVTLNAGDSIYAGMFKNAALLESVELPAELTSIGKEAFAGASKLAEISIPASVTEIAEDAFIYCASLSAIEVDPANKDYTSNNSNCIVKIEQDEENGTIETLIVGCSNTVIYEGVERIGQYAFVGCTDLEALHIPVTVTDIAEGAFYGCTSLASITVDENNAKYIAVDNCLIIPHSMRLVQGCKNSKIGEDIEVRGEVKKLESISAHAFAGCTGLKEISIPTGIKVLEADTFKGCINLTKVEINNKELKFNGDVFSGCSKFEKIKVPMHLLGYFIEKAKTVLKDVTITSGVKLEDNCFVGCVSLTTVNLPDELEEIGNGAFAGCEKLTHISITSSSKLNAIGHNAFDGCKAFTSIKVEDNAATGLVIPATVAYIGDYAFRGCAITALQFADNGALRTIGYKVFENCTKLENISIPSFIDTVDFYAFNGCEKITVATMPAEFVRSLANAKNSKGVSAIKTLTITSGVVDCYYIRDMKNLETLVIGKEVTDIDNKVFEGCSNLKSITVHEENSKYYAANNCIVEKTTEILVLGCGATNEIPENVKTIKSYAFSNSSITKVVIPAGVKVEAYAFSSCTNLKEIVINGDGKVDGVDAISPLAFDGCDKVVKAKVPANAIASVSKASLKEVEIVCGEIAAYAFKDCVTLEKVTISTEVTSVGDKAFVGCSKITEIEAPASTLKGFSNLELSKLTINKLDADVTSELVNNFKNITHLKITATNDSEKDYIKDGAFQSCVSVVYAEVPAWALDDMYTEKLENLVINFGAEVINGSFRFPELKSVTFGASVNSINAAVFSNSNKLAEIIVDEGNTKYTVETGCLLDGNTVVLVANGCAIPESVTAIGDYAFAGRNTIASVTLPEGLVSVGKYAFAGCTALTVDAFPASLETVGEYAFNGCASLSKVVLPGVKSIGAYAFYGCTSVTEISLPVVESLGEGAFEGCNAVVSASVPVLAIQYMPKSIEALAVVAGDKLDDGSIVGFANLKELTIGATVESISALMLVPTSGEYVNTLTSVTVDENNQKYYSAGAHIITKADNKLVFGCNVAEVVIPDGVVSIEENAFYNCNAIVSVEISATVADIHHFAFKGCTSIETLVVVEGNATYYSQGNCVLTSTVVDEAEVVTLVMGCKNSVIPENVNVIGDYAFYGATGLANIEIPASVTSIGNYAFANTGVIEMRLPASVTSIGKSAFEGCLELNKVIVLENGTLDTVGELAFSGCTKLNFVVLPNTITAVAENAFDQDAGVKVFWGGTEEEFNALSDELKAALPGDVIYFSANHQPGFWHYKQPDGLDVEVW